MNNSYDIKRILKFYQKYTILEGVSKLFYSKMIDISKYPFDFINANTISIEGSILSIYINKQMRDFIIGKNWKQPGISPISYVRNTKIDKETFNSKLRELKNVLNNEEEINKKLAEENYLIDENLLLFSPIYLKMALPEENREYFLPIIFLDLTKYKEKIKTFDYVSDEYLKISLDLNDMPIIYNDFVVSIFMNENMKEIFNDIWYLTARDQKYDNIEKFLEDIYDNLLDKVNDKIILQFQQISFPDIKAPIEPLGLFFGIDRAFFEDEGNLKIENNQIFKIKENKLLKSVLINNKRNIISDNIENGLFLGSIIDYPLSKGQSKVLIEDYNDNEIVSVFGAPGTGKTTLIASLVGENIVKRALSLILYKKDINNSILITSTSNKSLENIMNLLDEKISPFIYHETGSYAKRKANIEKIEKILYSFYKEDYNEEKFNNLEKTIKKVYKQIEDYKQKFINYYNLFKKNMNISNIQQLESSFLDDSEKEKMQNISIYISEINENIINELNELLDENKDLMFYMNFISSPYFSTLKKISNLSSSNFIYLVDSFLGISKKRINDFNKNNGFFEIKNVEQIEELVFLLTQLKKEEKKIKKFLKYLEDKKDIIIMEDIYKQNKNIIKQIFKYDDFVDFYRKNTVKLNKQLFLLSKEYLKQIALMHKNKIIEKLKKLQRDFYKVDEDIDDLIQDISLLIPVFITTLAGYKNFSSNFSIPVNKDHIFDLVIFDESSMVKITEALLPISHSNRIISIGDPKQLKPINSIDKLLEKYMFIKIKEDKSFYNSYSPTKISLYHRVAGISSTDNNIAGNSIILDEHRRCQKDIAETFLKIAAYPKIKILTPELPIENISPFKNRLVMYNVKNPNKEERLINLKEVETINKIIDLFKENSYIDITKDIGIITPYVKQERALIDSIGRKINYSNDNKNIGTVHKFQGAEYKVVIFSSVVSNETENLNFINKNESLINVAVSRAKELFILVGDKDKLLEENIIDNYIGQLVEIIENKGKII